MANVNSMFAPIGFSSFLRNYSGQRALWIQRLGSALPAPSTSRQHIRGKRLLASADWTSIGWDRKVSQSYVVYEAEASSELVAHWCSQLGRLLVRRVSANIYVSPPAGYAIERHSDPHDVLILQLSGQKKWNLSLTKLDDVSLILHAEDLLYLPAGTLHGTAAGECGSVHLTFGLHCYDN